MLTTCMQMILQLTLFKLKSTYTLTALLIMLLVQNRLTELIFKKPCYAG